MNDDSLLLRQIHPTFVQNGDVTSQAFRPTEEHQFKLSAYNGDLIEAKSACEHYTATQQKETVGVLAVTVSECTSLELPTAESPEVFPEHCHVDFNNLARKKVEQKGKLLRDRAIKRGWQYQLTR